MGSKENYKAIVNELKKIENDKVRTPDIPISAYLQEAEDQYHIAKGDAGQLSTAGVCIDMIESLNERAGACRYAQSIWNKEQNERQEASKLWKEKAPGAFDLRNELVHSFYFAFRKNGELIRKVQDIDEGYSNADMIQDLSDLALLGKDHQDELAIIKMDTPKLDKASNVADKMADLLAAANGDRFIQNENKQNRDRAYTYLKEMVDEIRAAGKYIFWKDENKLRGYRSNFLKRKKSRQKPEITNEEQTLI